MAYDSDRQRVVLYGGRDYVNANLYFTDTWEWDGASWERKSTVGPNLLEVPPHTIYDRSRHRVIAMAAGSDAAYEWNGSFWTQIDGTGPTLIHNAYSLVYDQTHARTLLLPARSSSAAPRPRP
jgi:hypothetical protein